MIAALLLLLQAARADDTVGHADPNRGAYKSAVDACVAAEKMLPGEPESAIEKLAPVFFDIDKGKLTKVERILWIYEKAQEGTQHKFFPYFLRGSARFYLAQKRKDEEARRSLIDATLDLQKSVELKAEPGLKLLESARKELWENLRAALVYESWKVGRSTFADEALRALSTTELWRDVQAWLRTEVAGVDAQMRELRKQTTDLEVRKLPARKATDWCAAILASIQGLPNVGEIGIAAGKAAALASQIRDSKGYFQLKIAVNPWARVERFARDGETIELKDRDTPLLVPQPLEIDDYTLELFHPKNGRKIAKIFAKSLEPGRTYVLWGDMSGDRFEVAELLPK